MKLIIGLGNVGDKYCFTRHNAGFMVLDKWAIKEGFSFKMESKFKAFVAKHKIGTDDVLFIKPTTFMNLSGEAVRLVLDYYKILTEDIVVIYDDIALNLGTIRLRSSGSDGGHNGIKSIIKNIGSSDFNRIKIGIGPQIGPSEHYVLQNFSKDQLEILKSEILDKVIEATISLLTEGIDKAQNKYN